MGTIYTKPAVTPAWGETNTTGADMIQPADGAIQTGWPLSATPPSRQIFNWILHFAANAIRYLMQRGLPDWDPNETYSIGGLVIGDDNVPYRSLVTPNNNHAPSGSPVQWALLVPPGLTLASIDAATLTQATQAAGDNSTKVATTAFVTAAGVVITAAYNAAITAATTAITAAYTAAIAAAGGGRTLQMSVVTGTRALGAAQAATTDLMLVTVSGSIAAGVGHTATLQAVVDGNVVDTDTISNGSGFATVTFAVKNGKNYQVNTGGIGAGDTNSVALTSWVEWYLA